MSTEPVPKDEEGVVVSIEDNSSEEDAKKRDVLTHEADDKPMREWSFMLFGKEVYINPFTSLFGFAFLWALSIWCMIVPTQANDRLNEWKTAVSDKFTWFYVVANPSFTFFVFYIACRYGHIKLGKKDEKPEFDDASYFMMLFSAGVAVGLFFYGVAEPLWHRGDHWFAEAGYRSQDEIDQFALMITMYHWGFAGWSPYSKLECNVSGGEKLSVLEQIKLTISHNYYTVVVAIAAGLAAYRFDMPMTIRSCLYQVLGELTWGWIGDVVDGFCKYGWVLPASGRVLPNYFGSTFIALAMLTLYSCSIDSTQPL